ncbi:MAG: ion channel [Woeseiaceae bacterium]
MTLKFEFKGYKALLFALLAILLIFPALQDFEYAEFVSGVVLMGVLLLAVRATANKRSQFVLSGILGTAAVVGHFGNLLGLGTSFELLGMLGFGLFFLAAGAIIMTSIMLHIRRVTAEMIYGSINVYLLIGISFAFIHRVVEFIQPGSISGIESLSMGDGAFMPYLYYSFVTMTTLGYGDVSPVTGPAASLAYVQAIFGQFYIAILVARLMGLYVAHETNQD